MNDLLPVARGRWFVVADNRLNSLVGPPKVPLTSQYYEVVFWTPRMIALDMHSPYRSWIYLHEDLLTDGSPF